MKNRIHALTLTALILALAASFATVATAGDRAAHTASTELQWLETPIGALVSPVAGDMNETEHITYIRFAAGMTTPLHTHTHSYVGVVVSGTTRHWVPNRPETKKELAPGGHWAIPAGQEHVSECLPGLDCIMAIVQEGAFDFIPTESSDAADG